MTPNNAHRHPPNRLPAQLTFERTPINLALSYDENAVGGNRPDALRLRPLRIIAPR
jgi:hypothetical protein